MGILPLTLCNTSQCRKNACVTSVCELAGFQPVSRQFCKKMTAKNGNLPPPFSFEIPASVDRHFHFLERERERQWEESLSALFTFLLPWTFPLWRQVKVIWWSPLASLEVQSSIRSHFGQQGSSRQCRCEQALRRSLPFEAFISIWNMPMVICMYTLSLGLRVDMFFFVTLMNCTQQTDTGVNKLLQVPKSCHVFFLLFLFACFVVVFVGQHQLLPPFGPY